MQKEASQFTVEGVRLTGYFHFPDEADKTTLPVIVMMNGYATEWDFGTQSFIDAFTHAGFITFNFDYRYFGGSDGFPRQMVDIPAQLDDCRAAIKNVLGQPWYKNSPLVLWGSSLGGGHAISMAAEHFNVAALVAQVPHCCSRAAMKTVKISAIFQGMFYALQDVISAKTGGEPKTIPVVAEPQEYGVMNHRHWKAHYLSIASHSKTWKNAIPARSLLKGGDYRPLKVAKNIRCPALLIAGKSDSGVPLESVRETASYIDKSSFVAYDGEHFDVYEGINHPVILAKEMEFLREMVLCY